MKHLKVMRLCLAACLGLGVDNAGAQDKFETNANLSDPTDYSINTTSALSRPPFSRRRS